MGAKIKVYGIIFTVLYVVVLVAKADEAHHIEQRILEENDINCTAPQSQNSVPNKLKKSSVDDIVGSLSSSTVNPSQKLEQILDKMEANPPPAPNNKKSAKSKNDKQKEAKVFLPNAVKPCATNSQKAVGDTNHIPQQKFNVSCLLRNDSINNTIEAPSLFPNGTSVNGTIDIIEGDPEKLQTMISQTNNATEKTNVQSDLQNKTAENDSNRTEINNKMQTTEANNNTTDTEVKDLLQNKNMQDSDLSNQVPQKPQSSIQIPDKINYDTKLIQNGENTEDKLRHSENSKNDDDANVNQRHLAAIIVSSLVAASVLCYAVLLIWRRYLENRYGSRTMLVNEEDFDDPTDMRNFSDFFQHEKAQAKDNVLEGR